MGKFLSNFEIKIDGANAPREFYDAVADVTVESSIGLPCMAAIRLRDPSLTWVDSASLGIGKPLEITARPDSTSGASSGVLFKGEITALEPHFSGEGKTELTIRGYDKSHRLHRGRKTRTFLNKKDSDIATTIAGEAGLSAQVDATTTTYEFVIQYNQTNMEFLMARAERIGYQVMVAEGVLYFKKGTSSTGNGPALVFMENLLEFEPRWTTHHQADAIKVQGWDVKQKTLLSGSAAPNASLNQGGMTKTGGELAKSAFSAAEEVVVRRPVTSAGEASELATGLSNDISREFIEAEGVCDGNPGILAGRMVEISHVGQRFSGKYYVTTATHVRDSGGYRTLFSISGRTPNTLSSLLSSNGDGALETGSVSGVVVALVTNLKDPLNLGRVKVKYAWLGEIESDWIRIASLMAGPERGLLFLPEVNDEVLVAFEHGDVQSPIIVGMLWNGKDKPPITNATAAPNGKVDQRIFKTRQGHTVLFDDKDGEEKISIKSKSGHELILDDKKNSESITIKDKSGNNSMVIKSSDNSMAIKVTGDFNVTATGKITLKSTQDMTLESSANAKLKGTQLAMEGSAKSELKGAMVSVNGSGQTEVKGGGMVQIQGAIVKIN